MSADKYAQFIAEQQKKLSVSGTNPVNLIEKKELSDKQKDIAKLAGDKDEIDAEDLKKLRSKKKDDDDKDDKDDDKDDDDDKSDDKDDDKDDDKPAFFKKKMKEEVEQINEKDSTDVEMNKKMGMTPIYKPSKISGPKNSGGYKSNTMKALKPKTVKEEASYISEEESQYIEEMVSKGKLPEIADFHKKAADHAYKMRVHHQMMADKSEDVGDSEGFDHHIEQAMRHDYDHEHHMARFDHAASLKARNQAHKDLKAAKDKAAKARDAKRDWA